MGRRNRRPHIPAAFGIQGSYEMLRAHCESRLERRFDHPMPAEVDEMGLTSKISVDTGISLVHTNSGFETMHMIRRMKLSVSQAIRFEVPLAGLIGYRALLLASVVLALISVGCSSDDSGAEAATTVQVAASSAMTNGADPGSLVIYAGRSESLVAPVIKQFREATGINVQVKYGGSSAIAATIQEEGENSPADVFWAQEPGALAALSAMFRPLPSDITLSVPEWARASDSSWVGVTGRARVIVHSSHLDESELPKSVEELTDPKWKGRVGWAPTNSSFRVMVTAMRQVWGEDKTREWLEGMIANDVRVYPKNTPIVDAAGKGEVDVGLVNHYYLHRFIAEHGDDFGARNLFLNDGGPGKPGNGRRIGDSEDRPEPGER